MSKLADVTKEADKKMGRGTLFKVGDMGEIEVPRYPTGVFWLDQALGGGFPGESLSEIFGPAGLGKTTILYNTIGQAQAAGKECVLIDLEGSLNAQMARGSGIDIERLHLAQPESGEQVLELCEMLIDADDVAVVGIDSIAGMTPAAVIAGDYGDSHVGVQARMLSQGLSKLKSQIRLKKPQAAFIFTNQIRYKIGQMGYGDPTTTPGGEAMKFYPDVRLDVRKGEWRKETGAEEPWGHELKVKTVKNRLAPPLRVAHLDMVYGQGISNSSSLVDLAERLGIVKKSGAWYAWVSTGESIGQGRTKAILRLDEDEELRNAIAEETGRAYSGVDSAESD